MKIDKKHHIITLQEAASILKVSKYTIKRYIYSGKLEAIRLPSSHWRVIYSSCIKLLEDGYYSNIE